MDERGDEGGDEGVADLVEQNGTLQSQRRQLALDCSRTSHIV